MTNGSGEGPRGSAAGDDERADDATAADATPTDATPTDATADDATADDATVEVEAAVAAGKRTVRQGPSSGVSAIATEGDAEVDTAGEASDAAGAVPARGGLIPRGRRATLEIARVPSWLATASAWAWRTLLLIVALAVVLWVMVELYLVTLPVIIALILATLCVPPARWLESHGAPRVVAATVVVIGGLATVGGLIAALIPPFIEQAQELRPTLLLAVDQLFAFLEANFGWDQEEVMEMLEEGLAALGQRGGEIAGQVLTGAALAIQGVVALTLAIVLLFFFVKDGEQITSWMIDRSPDRHEATVRAVGRRSWAALAGFVRGTAAIALIDAVGIGVGLAIVGVPLVLPIAVLVFLGGFVPVIGAFVTGLLAVVVALVAGGLQQGLIVLAIVVGVQQFESNVLQPVIMRRAVALHPVVILAALTAGAALIGVIGAFLAVPIAAVASAATNELRLRHEARAAGVPVEEEDDPIGPPHRPVATDKL